MLSFRIYACNNNLFPRENKVRFKQGIAGDTNPLAQDYLVRGNTKLGNSMTYNSYVNEETKSLWP